MTDWEKERFKRKIEGQLNCSPKPTFAQEMYRQFITNILNRHPKFSYVITQTNCPGLLGVWNLLVPNCGFGSFSDIEAYKRCMRWFRWFRKITEDRELKVEKLGSLHIKYS